MKRKLKIALLTFAALLLLAGGGVFTYLFGGPYRFIQVPLQEASLQHLRSSPAASTPAGAADQYLHGLVYPADRPQRQRLEIAVRYTSEQEAVVTVINRFCSDDSLDVEWLPGDDDQRNHLPRRLMAAGKRAVV